MRNRRMPLLFTFSLLGTAPTVTAQAFVHPGLLHTRADLDRMKTMVTGNVQPYRAGYDVLRVHAQSQSNYALRGPFANISRNPDAHKTEVESDANAAYQNALMWAITGTQAYAAKAIQILNAWSSTLTSITGRDSILASSLTGFKFVNAAEILRHTGTGWAAADVARCQNMLRNVFYPVIRNFADFANGNWETGCIKTMIGIGAFSDDRVMYDRAANYYLNGGYNGRLIHYVINDAGQCQESGRDQTHSQLGLGHLAEAAEIAWNQGQDLYSSTTNRLLKGFEYTASYNLGNTVPFVPYTDKTGKYTATVISNLNRGQFRPIYEMMYNHFANRRGLPAASFQYAKQVADQLRPEGAAFTADHPGFGTILFTRPYAPTPIRPVATIAPSRKVLRFDANGRRLRLLMEDGHAVSTDMLGILIRP